MNVDAAHALDLLSAFVSVDVVISKNNAPSSGTDDVKIHPFLFSVFNVFIHIYSINTNRGVSKHQ